MNVFLIILALVSGGVLFGWTLDLIFNASSDRQWKEWNPHRKR